MDTPTSNGNAAYWAKVNSPEFLQHRRNFEYQERINRQIAYENSLTEEQRQQMRDDIVAEHQRRKQYELARNKEKDIFGYKIEDYSNPMLAGTVAFIDNIYRQFQPLNMNLTPEQNLDEGNVDAAVINALMLPFGVKGGSAISKHVERGGFDLDKIPRLLPVNTPLDKAMGVVKIANKSVDTLTRREYQIMERLLDRRITTGSGLDPIKQRSEILDQLRIEGGTVARMPQKMDIRVQDQPIRRYALENGEWLQYDKLGKTTFLEERGILRQGNVIYSGPEVAKMTPEEFLRLQRHEVRGHLAGRGSGTQGRFKELNELMADLAEEQEPLSRSFYDLIKQIQLNYRSEGGLIYGIGQGSHDENGRERYIWTTGGIGQSSNEFGRPRGVLVLQRDTGDDSIITMGDRFRHRLSRTLFGDEGSGRTREKTHHHQKGREISSTSDTGRRSVYNYRYGERDKIHQFNQGGRVPGLGDKDTIPAMLTPDEFVVRAPVAKKYGTFLTAINNGRDIGYSGGIGYAAGGGISFGDELDKKLKKRRLEQLLTADNINKITDEEDIKYIAQELDLRDHAVGLFRPFPVLTDTDIIP